MIKVRNLDAWYDYKKILFNINIDILPGDVTAILGSNGSGKSTLAAALLGLVASSGTILLSKNKGNNKNFQSISSLKAHQRIKKGLVLVPQDRHLFPQMKVIDHLLLAKNYRFSIFFSNKKADPSSELSKIFEIFPRLQERQNQLAGTLSGGEQQMLAIARGLISNPQMLILDEPSLGLSPKISQEVFRAIEKLNKEGLTILLIEQNIAASLELAKNLYLLESGVMSKRYSPLEIKKNSEIFTTYFGREN